MTQAKLPKTHAKAIEILTARGEMEEGAARTAGCNLSALYALARTGVLTTRKGTFIPVTGPYAGTELPTTYYSV